MGHCSWLCEGIRVLRLQDAELAVAIFHHSLKQLDWWESRPSKARAQRLLGQALHACDLKRVSPLLV